MLKAPSWPALLLLALIAVAFFVCPVFAGIYEMKFATRLIILSTFVVSLDFLLGLAGMVSFGHAAFFGVGAYAVYFISPESGPANALLAVGTGAAAGAIAALVIGALACLTRGFYFIMVTLAAGQMMFSLFHDTDIAKGSDGAYINVKPDIEWFGRTLLDFDDRRTLFYVCLVILIATVLVLFALARSPFGRVVQGLKSNETRLSALGYDTYKFRLAAFVIAGTFAGIAGSLFACIDGFVTPELFSWHESGLAIMMVVLGGAGTLFGPILGVLSYISLEELLKASSLVGDIVASHWRLGTGVALVIAVLLSPDGLAGFLRTKPRAKKPLDDLESKVSFLPRKASVIATRELAKTFGGLKAVDNVTVSFEKDQIHAIIGPNGAGKTTFTNLLSGALKPTAGDIFVDGVNIAGWPSHKIARLGVGRSFQRTNIFLTFTVAQNCQLAAQAANPSVLRFLNSGRSQESAVVSRALRIVGLSDRAHTVASALSNGEQRQLEIATLIAGGGSILILDEPLAGMGPEETRRVVDLLRDLRHNHTIILIEHDVDAVFAVADTLTVLALGRLIGHGSPDKVRMEEKVIAAYLGKHARERTTA